MHFKTRFKGVKKSYREASNILNETNNTKGPAWFKYFEKLNMNIE